MAQGGKKGKGNRKENVFRRRPRNPDLIQGAVEFYSNSHTAAWISSARLLVPTTVKVLPTWKPEVTSRLFPSSFNADVRCWEKSQGAHAASRTACRGRYTREVRASGEFEIVVPRKVLTDGQFLSYQLPHHYKRSYYKDRHRDEMTPDDMVHYRVAIDGEEHHLELYPNHKLLSPGAVLEDRILEAGQPATDEDFLRNGRIRRLRDTECHYHGGVRDHNENSALSACYGLAGYIRTKRSLYVIEPLEGYDFTKDVEHPHIVYKRASKDFEEIGKAMCKVNQNIAEKTAKRVESRQKRDAPKNATFYTIELLVVLDRTLLEYHKDFDVENYVLTLFNMAAGLFQDISLGVEMELVIVRIIRLGVEEDEMNLSVNKDADFTLKYFQQWQQKMNPGDDTHPNHHDAAVLITKIDICLTQSLCGFTGITTIGSTCDPVKGAVVIKDDGLRTGYNIAHQIGHTLGMSHDSKEENGCSGITVHRDGYIETSVMYSGNPYVTKGWSKCSQSSIKAYLRSGMGACLEDEAQDHQFIGNKILPGVMYNGDDQCRLYYRQDVRQCDLGIWCYQMKCLPIGERPGAIDANWGAWSPWSRCSRTCGSGVAFSERKCNHPKPSNGGETCQGIKKRHKICATEPCEIGTPSFRDVQCAEFNDWVFPEDGKIHQWVGYNLPENLKASENPCVLFCLSETKLLTSLKPKVVDGTTCYRGIRDVCIGGTCREIPCNLDMESNAVEDMCGVCKGDSTSCLLKEGTKFIAQQPRLKKLLDVPKGAKNIRVEITEPTKSRIVVRTKGSKNVLIDGNRLGMFDVPGSKAWLGMIRARQEALNIPGPVSEELVVLENATLKYSLGLNQENPRKPEFSWNYIDWTRCNALCGPGEAVSVPKCVEKIGGEVDDTFCKKLTKPGEKIKPCNQAPCVPRWMIGDWQGCSPCTPGCKKERAVKCIRPVGHGEQEADVIAESYCQGPKPKESQQCLVRTRRNSGNESADKEENNADEVSVDDEADELDGTSLGVRNSIHELDGNDGGSKMDTELADVGEFRMNQKLSDTSDRASIIEKRTDQSDKQTTSSIVSNVKEAQVVFDKQDIKNLTLTIILERDDNNNVVNFPKDFVPQPKANETDFTLVGMDAVKYIQLIQEEDNTSLEPP
ncbi:A disintegrin and metalloproteinase with thrombospondin motifs 12-like [Diprion similis]|uniref:A disintegrin and metalloproteinase with thrombospondin motifs 12-like n=1 Tax=Diprion similis TaxID=362088 RepID=UPI001EF89881|nr:A disintegrin and metalloproteinase with thrombospondin motifs 12-like [Diprion similis]